MLDIFQQAPWFLYACLFPLGLIVGSFLNVVVYRLPLMMESQWRRDCCELLEVNEKEDEIKLTLSTPNSHCPHCKAPVKPWHNIPVLSYVALRGRCANCGAKIALRYPLVELATGLMTLALGIMMGASLAMVGALFLTWALITLTLIDVDHQLLPDDITLPLLWLGLVFNLFATYTTLSSAVIGAIAGYGILWSVYWGFKLLTGKEGMGYGDFKLLAALGAWLGWQSVPLIILLSSLVGAIIGIGLILLKKRGKDIPMPFGPYLAIAGWVALLWGDTIMTAYLG
ncbi:prepilin peptidase [Halioglobus pacificus]|uniref:Prepilin leader peptidase/N-methyltransferase n=1 Tax=Parahalioglobus pacificus TaxID=930806 RepID=A0A919CHN7_9GAMM|nr:type 4 prepilin-like proteins leader peptide-processing enzyme [Halioglobus pacificus]